MKIIDPCTKEVLTEHLQGQYNLTLTYSQEVKEEL